MSDREQAIKDVAAELGCDADILSHQMDMDPKFICNNGEYKVYAVSQRERVIALERALREMRDHAADLCAICNECFDLCRRADDLLGDH